MNDEQSKSLIDSISATSGRNNWSGLVEGRDFMEDNPSISSIRGDSVSATIADYNRKHAKERYKSTSISQNDSISKVSVGQQAIASSSRSAVIGNVSPQNNDDLSVNINYYLARSSSIVLPADGDSSEQQLINKLNYESNPGSGDIGSALSHTNVDAEDVSEIIEECTNNPTNSGSNVSKNNSTRKQTPSQQQSSNCQSSTPAKRTNTTHPKSHRRFHSKVRKSRSGQSHHHQGSHPNQRHRHQSSHHSDQVTALFEYDDLPQEASQVEPIIIKGNGNLTLFGLSNSFSSEFPTALVGRVSREEFDKTISKINALLRDQQSLSAKLLLFGGLFCCCSLGFSLVWPSIILKKRSKAKLEKLIASENNRLYSKLGLNWKLAEQRCYGNQTFIEYVLKIEFNPKLDLYQPD